MDRAPYQYNALNDSTKEVRFIKLNITDSDDQPLRCSVVHSKIDDPPLYAALSYAWGRKETPETLLIGENEVHNITASLYQALHDIRTIQRLGNVAKNSISLPYLIWADEVSINQEDKDEKAKQISLMGRLYSQAARVFVHTGPPLSGGQDLSHFLCVLGYIATHPPYSLAHALSEHNHIQSLSQDDKNLARNKELWFALKELLCREWTRRAWIVQEILRCSDSPRLLYGTKIVTLDEVTIASRLGDYDQGYMPRALRAENFDPDELDHIRRAYTFGIVQYQKRHEKIPIEARLAKYLDFFRGCQCYQAQDTIYCLSNLASDWEALQLRIDYDIDPAKLFTKAACRMINCSRSTDILHHVRAERRLSHPSWIPDWTQPSGGWPLINEWRPIAPLKNTYEYSAGGTSATWASADEATGVLQLKGCVFDHVRFVSEILEPRAMIDAASWAAWLEKYAGYLQSDVKRLTVPDVSIELVISLIAGKLSTWKKATVEETMLAFTTWQEDLQKGTLSPAPSLQNTEVSYVERILHCWPGRRWGRTSTGRMALLPGEASMGDAICIVPGMRTPFVLQGEKVDGRYAFVGDCYIHGVMDGELINSGELLFENISIG